MAQLTGIQKTAALAARTAFQNISTAPGETMGAGLEACIRRVWDELLASVDPDAGHKQEDLLATATLAVIKCVSSMANHIQTEICNNEIEE